MSISLALPVHNGENFLRQALESAVAQGPELAEIVVADNCSTDATAAIIAEFAARDPRVRHERSEEFLNQADNVSRAVRICRNEWVQMLCHDDLLRPGAISRLSAIIQQTRNPRLALIGHQPSHLFQNDLTSSCGSSHPAIQSRQSFMSTPAGSAEPPITLHKADLYLAENLRRGRFPSLPALTTAALRKSVFESLGGFSSRWVHFDSFFWIQLIQEHDFAETSENWTLIRVHSLQVAVNARKNLRSFRDYRDFYREFVPWANRRYKLGIFALLKLRLKPISQAAAPFVVMLHKRDFKDLGSQWMAMPLSIMTIVPLFILLNYFRERRRNLELWKRVPASLTYE